MAPSTHLQRAIAAFKAMKLLGFGQGVVKPVLKELVKVFENNWEFIEAENYRVLADAILDRQESKDPEANEIDVPFPVELTKPQKRLRHMEDSGPSQAKIESEVSGETLLKKKKLVASGEGGIGEMAPQHAINFEEPSAPLGHVVCYKEPKIELDTEALQETAIVGTSTIPDKPMAMTENGISTNYNVPIAVAASNRIPLGIADAPSLLQLEPNKGNERESCQVLAQNVLAYAHERLSTNVNIASSNTGKICQSATESGVPLDVKLSPPKECLKSSESTGISVPQHSEHDIAKGEERIMISIINEFNCEKTPPYFRYIPWNVLRQNAHVHFSLAQIHEDDCCINCFGNCLSVSIPCACTRQTGGKFVYTLDGLLNEEFLNECISINSYMDKRRVYCMNCPIGRFKGENKFDSCKGHVVRKFIKECWSKCGCNKQCANRVVQRGITYNLQVFYTSDGKGWGLRTLEELP